MKAILTMTLIALSSAAAGAGEAVTYTAEGRSFEGYLAKADSPKGAVVLIHDWDGVTDYEKSRADQLAALGYSAFAIDLYGKGVRPGSVEANMAETKKLYDDRPMMVALMQAGLKQAEASGLGPAVVMGYCFGGAATLQLAAEQPAGVVGYATFHAGIGQVSTLDYTKAKAPIRLWHGGSDANATMAAMSELSISLNEAGADWAAAIYGPAHHTFTVPGTPDYVEAYDRDSWAQFTGFLADRFK